MLVSEVTVQGQNAPNPLSKTNIFSVRPAVKRIVSQFIS